MMSGDCMAGIFRNVCVDERTDHANGISLIELHGGGGNGFTDWRLGIPLM